MKQSYINKYPRVGTGPDGVPVALRVKSFSRRKEEENLITKSLEARGYTDKSVLFQRAVRVPQPLRAARTTEESRSFGESFPGASVKGKASAFEVWQAESSPRQYAKHDASTLRAVYIQASAVRTAVDTIIREVTSIPWAVIPTETDPTRIKDVTWKRCLQTMAFLENPNPNPETFQQLISKYLTDLLVLDGGAIELVYGVTGDKLLELLARDAATFIPRVDRNGILQYYEQQVSRGGTTTITYFEPRELLYTMMYPQSNSIYGLPILDSVINEVAALLYAMDYIANSFSDSEIPPGILHLGTIGDEAYKRAKAEFKTQRGIKKSETKIRVIDNVDMVEWIQLKRPNREQQVTELLHLIEKIVYRNFGVLPTEVGLVEGVTRATAEVWERISQIKLIRPLMLTVTSNFNRVVIPGLGFNDVKFRYIVRRTVDNRDEALAEKDRVNTGLRTINETRDMDGYLPLLGGDRAFVLVGKRIYFLDELEKAVSEAWSQEGDQAIRGGHQDNSDQENQGD